MKPATIPLQRRTVFAEKGRGVRSIAALLGLVLGLLGSNAVLELELSGQIVRGPYLQMGTPTSMTVRWRTADVADGLVRCGTNQQNLDLSFSNGYSSTGHHVTLSGLAPNTKYFYAVGTSEAVYASGPEFFFVTSPTNSRPTRILVTSDMQMENPRIVPALKNFAKGRLPDFWLACGDLGEDDTDYQWNLFDTYGDILRQAVIWPTMGNHDSWVASLYRTTFYLPANGEAGGEPSGTKDYYSFNYGGIHCVVLNSVQGVVDTTTNGPMYAWLARDLAANDRDWLIAYWHYPPYTKGAYDSDRDASLTTMRENFLPLLEAQGVDLVLCGHNHIYERSYLLDSHYGVSTTLDARTMIKNGGDGRRDGCGPYCKASTGPSPHQGTVYAKVTSAYAYWVGEPHPVMFTAQWQLGCLILDIDGPVLDATFLRDDGQIGDYFTIMKGVQAVPPRIAAISVAEGQTTLQWNSVPQRYYRVFRSYGLSSGWTPASPWLWTESRTASWSEPVDPASPTVFYRIQIATE